MGGTQAKCYYSCPANALVAIAVKSADADAGVWGNTKCGDAKASCNSPSPTCAGTSEGMTQFAERNAACRGNSDEFWDSPLTVGCIAVGVEPAETLCRKFPELCEGSTGSASSGEANDDPAYHCVALLEPSQAAVLQEFLLQGPAGAVYSFVLQALAAEDPFTVTYDVDTGCRVSQS